MSTPKSQVLLRRIEQRIEVRAEQVRQDVHTRWHSDGTDVDNVVQDEMYHALVEDDARGLSLPLRDAMKMAETLRERLAPGAAPLNSLETFSLNLLTVLLGCAEPVYSLVTVEAEFGPVTLTHQQPLDTFRKGLQMSMVQSDQTLSNELTVENLQLVKHQLDVVSDASGFLKTAQLSGKVRFVAKSTAGAESLTRAVDTLLLTLRHRSEPMQPARVTLRHLVLSDVTTD